MRLDYSASGTAIPAPGQEASLHRQFHFGVTAWRRGIHGGSDSFQPLAHQPPTSLTENNQRDFPVCQILLVLDALVARYDHIESSILGGRE